MTDINLKNDVSRAEHAQRLVDDELLNAALDAIEQEVIRAWGDSRQADKDEKEALWQLYKTSQKFRAILIGHIETGKLAALNLKRFEDRRGLFRAFG